MSVDESVRAHRSRRTYVVIAAIAVVVVVAGSLGALKVNADAAAHREAIDALATANATFEALAQNDGRELYVATLTTAQAYVDDAARVVPELTTYLGASTLSAFVESVAMIDAAIDGSTPGRDVDPEKFEPPSKPHGGYSTDEYREATARANAAIASAINEQESTDAATLELEHAILVADSALIDVAATVPATAAAVLAARPELAANEVAFVSEHAAAVKEYLDERETQRAADVDKSDAALVAHIGDELRGRAYLSSQLALAESILWAYRV